MKKFFEIVIAGALIVFFISYAYAGETINFSIGKVLDPEINPFDQPWDQRKPKLIERTVNGQSTIYAFWGEESMNSPNYRVAVSKSTDKGNTWSVKNAVLNNRTSVVCTIAGNGTAGDSGDGGPAKDAQLNRPSFLAWGDGGLVFSDTDNNRIRKIDGNGNITTVAGNGTAGFSGDGGPATQASLDHPAAFNPAFSWNPPYHYYIADSGNNRIRKVDADDIITTVAGNGIPGFSGDGGPASEANLNSPRGIATLFNWDTGQTILYIADSGNNRIRKIDCQTGIITTVAGNGTAGFSGDGGPAIDASLSNPTSLSADWDGNIIFADTGNNRIRKIDGATGIITTIAGNGTAVFSGDGGLAIDAGIGAPTSFWLIDDWVTENGEGWYVHSIMYLNDSSNNRIRKIDFKTGIITTIAGNGMDGFSGDGEQANRTSFSHPGGFVLDWDGNCIVADTGNNRIRKILFNPPSWSRPFSAEVDGSGTIYIVTNDLESNTGGFRTARYSNGTWTEGPQVPTEGFSGALSMKSAPDGNIYLMSSGAGNRTTIYRLNKSTITWQETGRLEGQTAEEYGFCIDGAGKIYLFTGGWWDSVVQFYVSNDYGATWTGPHGVSNGQGGLEAVNVGPSGKVDLAFNNFDHLYFTRCQDGNLSFSAPVRVDEDFAETEGRVKDVCIFYNGQDTYVVWTGEPYRRYGCYEIDYVARSTDGGKTFGRNFRASWGDYNGECADHPSTIATTDANGNTIFVHTWQDDRYAGAHGNPRNPRKIYTATGRLYTEDPRILVVEDDYSEQPTPETGALDYNNLFVPNNYHNYYCWYTDALFKSGIPFDYYDMPGMGRLPGLGYMQTFDAVIWETGLESKEEGISNNDGSVDSLNQEEQDLLARYLDGGGKLFLCSQDFLMDVTAGVDGPVVNSFANNYLSVTDVINVFDQCDYYDGVAGDPIGDGLRVRTTDTISFANQITGATFYLRFFNYINTKRLTHGPDAKAVFTFNGGDIAIRKCVEPYSLVYFGFPFETINQYNNPPDTNNTRPEVMARVIGWLDSSQGYILSKSNSGLTKDSFYGVNDKLNIFAWCGRINPSTIQVAEAELLRPDSTTVMVPLEYNSSKSRYEGSLKLKNEPKGNWKIKRITLLDAASNRYEVSNKYINLSTSIEPVKFDKRWAPITPAYDINFKVKDEAGRQATVTAYYYNIKTPEIRTQFGEPVTLDVSSGEAAGTVTLDLANMTAAPGEDYGIYLSASVGGTDVYSYSVGTIAMLDTVDFQYPGYSNYYWSKCGEPWGDYDGDGVSNYQEAKDETDPGNPESYYAIRSYFHSSGLLTGTTFTLTGGASYAGVCPGIEKVEISLDEGNTWALANGTTNWSYEWAVPAPGQYHIMSRATDNNGRVETPAYYGTFVTVDWGVPTSNITAPANGAIISETGCTVTGNFSDDYLWWCSSRVDLSFDGGVTWNSLEFWGSDWSYNWVPPAEGIYDIKTRARDCAGNTEVPGPGTTVFVDSTAPTSTILTPSDNEVVPVHTYTITGTASDSVSGITRVEVSTDGGVTWSMAAGTSPWNFSWDIPAVGQYAIKTRAVDLAGNWEAPGSGITVEYNPGPTTTASPGAGKYLLSQAVSLTPDRTATVYYTLNGSTPDTTSRVYSTPIVMGRTTTLKFFGVDGAGNREPVRTAHYDVEPVSIWTRQNGTAVFDMAYGISSDPAGNVYVAGITGNTSGFLGGDLDGEVNSGGYDAFVTKYDSDGNRSWTRLIGSSANDGVDVHGVSAGPGGIYVSGYTDGEVDGNSSSGGRDVFVTRFDADGNRQWTRQLGTAAEDYAYSVAQDGLGDCYITGYTDGDLDGNLSHGMRDFFITKFDQSGNKLWTRQPGTEKGDSAVDVIVDPAGNLYAVGWTQSGLDGNVYAGSYIQWPYYDLFITKYDTNGIRLWTRQLGSLFEEAAIGAAADGSGNVYVTGYTGGGLDGIPNQAFADIFLIKYASNGDRLWTRQLGNVHSQEGAGVVCDGSGNVYVSGRTILIGLDGNNTMGGDADAYVAKYDPDGNRLWTRQFGTAAYDEGRSIAMDGNGNLYLAGITGGNLDGNTGSGYYDYFIMKLVTERTYCAITNLQDGAVISGPNYVITGTAGPSGSVTGVEVSMDGGETWSCAMDISPGSSWSNWSYTWETPGSGAYQIRTRLTDTSGNKLIPSGVMPINVN